MGLSKYETETVIRFNDASNDAIIYTCHKRIITAMAKRGMNPISLDTDNKERIIACTYEVPKTWIKISPPRKVSDKQREAARQNIKSALKKQSSN